MQPKDTVYMLAEVIKTIEVDAKAGRRLVIQLMLRDFFKHDYNHVFQGQVDTILLADNKLDPLGLHEEYVRPGCNDRYCVESLSELHELFVYAEDGSLPLEEVEKYQNSRYAQGYYSNHLKEIYEELIKLACPAVNNNKPQEV